MACYVALILANAAAYINAAGLVRPASFQGHCRGHIRRRRFSGAAPGSSSAAPPSRSRRQQRTGVLRRLGILQARGNFNMHACAYMNPRSVLGLKLMISFINDITDGAKLAKILFQALWFTIRIVSFPSKLRGNFLCYPISC